MGMLASAADANRHLDETKIKFVDDADAVDEADAALDEIAARIGGLWPDHIFLWDYSPSAGEEPTPRLVRYIASLLMASYRYAKKYSEEELSDNDYAVRLETRALHNLDLIATGAIDLWDAPDPTGPVAGKDILERGDFWPDDTYTYDYERIQREAAEADPELQPNRAFSMDMGL